MNPTQRDSAPPSTEEIIGVFDDLSGLHPGFRPAHAKGVLLAGTFTPSPAAKALTRAPHLDRSSTPVTVRFSDSSGFPTIPDNDPNASPRGIAIRFHLAEHVHTDIIAHSVDGFPARDAAELMAFFRAVLASGPEASKPTPIETFLGSHPAALEFVQAPKPFPASFAKESFFAVTAHKFTNKDGVSRFGRYRIRPDGAGEFVDDAAAAAKPPNFLFDEIAERLSKSSVKMRIVVQVAAEGDTVNDATVHWPKDRPEIDFGTVELTQVVQNNADEQRHIIFDPIPRVDGIQPSDDPLLATRADVYLATGRRRRANAPK